MASPHRSWLVTTVPLLAALGCGFESSNAVDPATDPALDPALVPVRIEHVRVRQSLVAGLGTGPVTLSGRSAPNAIGVAYEVVTTAAVPEHAGVSARLVCASDGHVVASQMAFDASRRLERVALGGRIEGSEVLMPGAFVRSIPETCEVRFVFTISPPLAAGPAPAPVVRPLATVCFADGELRDGACTDDELPRVAEPGVAAAPELDAELVTRDDGDVRLEARARVTAGASAPDDASVRVLATCVHDGEPHALPLMMWLPLAGLHPGESVVEAASVSTVREGRRAPQRCTLEALLERRSTAREPLARWCVRPGDIQPGDCA